MSSDETGRTWIVHQVDPERDRDMLLRAREVFWGKPDEDYLQWFYYNNPAGTLFCALAMDGETIAGQYVVIPLNLIVNGELTKGSLSLDTFTNPKYRRQGIFTILAEDVFSCLIAQGFSMTLGFPNKLSRPGFLNKLHFTEPYRAYTMVRPISPIPGKHPLLGKVSARMPLGFFNKVVGRLKGLTFEQTNKPDIQIFDELWQARCGNIAFGHVKDAAWMNWRYLNHPRQSYQFLIARYRDGRPAGYLVWNEKIRDLRFGYKYLVLMDVVNTEWWIGTFLLQTFLEVAATSVNAVKALSVLWSPPFFQLMATGFVPVKPISVIRRLHENATVNLAHRLTGSWTLSHELTDAY
jgi:GNAT superfamily N-acetyltransferase